MSSFLSPASADINLKAVGAVLHCAERAFADAATTVIADGLVGGQDLVHYLRCAHGTGSSDRAFFTAAAFLSVKLGNALADNTKVV